MRSDWVSEENMEHVLAALMPANKLVIQVSIATGLRVSDVLNINREQMAKGRFTVTEQKTGKKRRVRIPVKLQRQCLAQAGQYLVFPGRLDETRPRSRQAVYKDVVRAAKSFRIDAHVSPHTARKIYAENQFDKKGLDAVQRDLGHSSREITMIYAMAREITMRKLTGKK